MGIKQTAISQGQKPTGVLGWIVAGTMPLLFRSLYAQVARLLDVGPEDEVLDVACGSGVFLRRYATHAKRIAGVDHSEIQIGVARRLNRSRVAEGTAEFVQGDSAALPWGDGRFSAVTCNCLGCFDEPQRSLEEMCRVLRQGGRAVISTDYYPDEAKAREDARKTGLPTWTAEELATVMAAAGFSGVRVSHDEAMVYATAIKM